MKSWTTRSRKTVFSQTKWLTVEHHEVELPDGRIIPDWIWVISPDYVNVVACTEDEHFLMFRQTKYGVKGDTLAIVGGYLNPDEEPLTAARRELVEETGYTAEKWIDLGHFLVDPNRGIATGHLYLAMESRFVASPIQDDLEEQELILLTREELKKALDQGEIKVLAWAAAISFALARLP